MTRFACTALLLTATVTPLLAQGRRAPVRANADAARVPQAVATITEADYRQRIAVIADDSMRGRGTPSPELEQVAAYIAGEFQRFGLRGGATDGGFLQRYTFHRWAPDTTSYVMVMGRGVHGHWLVGRAATIAAVGGNIGQGEGSAPVTLVVGMPSDTAHPFGDVDVTGTVIVHVAPPQGRGRFGALNALWAKARDAHVIAWISLSNTPDSVFARFAPSALRPKITAPQDMGTSGLPVFAVSDASAQPVLQAAGEDIAALRAQEAWAVRPLRGFTGAYSLRLKLDEQASAPNAIGILDGSDPVLKNEYVFFTGHMDHVGVDGMGNGCRAVGADSICNGADDDASGTTGVVMLAQAFSQMNPRPRRSLVFMTVSGEERGLWGSRFYSDHPTLPLANTVADLNMDMIGRYFDNHPGWRDTIAVIGKEHSTLGALANQVTREHPELHMQLVDDIWPAENFYRRSDHFNFARKGVPILFFFNGTHPDYHRPSDSVDKIDAEKASRIVKMVFYVGLGVANATERPQWNPESRQRIVEAGN